MTQSKQANCRRCGTELMEDMNGIKFCLSCRRAARFVGVSDVERRLRSAVALADAKMIEPGEVQP